MRITIELLDREINTPTVYNLISAIADAVSATHQDNVSLVVADDNHAPALDLVRQPQEAQP